MSTCISRLLFGAADTLRTVGWGWLWVLGFAAAIRVIVLVGTGDWRVIPLLAGGLLTLGAAWLLRRVAGFVRAHDGA